MIVDIFIPFYQNVSNLKLAVESVEAQDCRNYTLTILDDGSEELATEKSRDWLNGIPHTFVRNETNLGMVENWNQALQRSRGFVTMLHCDDMLQPNYVQQMRKAAKAFPAASMYFCNATVINEKGQPAFSLPDLVKKFIFRPRNDTVLEGEEAVTRLLRGNFIFCPTMMFNMQMLGDFRFDCRWKMVQDLDFVLRLLESNHSIVGIPDACYLYRRHSNNATVAYTKNMVRFHEEITLYSEVEQRCKVRGWSRAERIAHRRFMIIMNLAYCAMRDFCQIDFQKGWQKLSLLRNLFQARLMPDTKTSK